MQCAHQKSPWGGINIARLIKHKSLNVKTDTFILSRLHLYRFLFNEKEKAYFFSLPGKCLCRGGGVTQLIILFLNFPSLWGCLILFSYEIICCSIIRALTLVDSILVVEIIQDERLKNISLQHQTTTVKELKTSASSFNCLITLPENLPFTRKIENASFILHLHSQRCQLHILPFFGSNLNII